MTEDNEQVEGPETVREMPLYNCHKQVRAAKILHVIYGGHGATLNLEKPQGSAVDVSNDYINKHDPQIGGYFVLYEDGYESFSPSEPFEAGYTEVESRRTGIVLPPKSTKDPDVLESLLRQTLKVIEGCNNPDMFGIDGIYMGDLINNINKYLGTK